jgi:ubiquinone/menaquinone biosynthesis C-methylase UbiE
MTSTYEFFDGQAATFDQRAGLPEEICYKIAETILSVGEVKSGDLVLEIGPGTGQIGRWFAPSVRYVGFDKSSGMLKEFKNRLDNNLDYKAIVQADAKTGWPFASGVARVIFGSRAIHLLDDNHVASEVFRVALPAGATFIVGRVQRDRASVRHQMARQMNVLLRQQGFEGLGGEGRTKKLFEICSQRQAEILEPVTVARWKVVASPQQSIDSWRGMIGLGGIPVPIEVKDRVLTKLAVWGEEEFGRLDQSFESEEEYALMPLRLSGVRTL